MSGHASRISNEELVDRVEEELALGKECLKRIKEAADGGKIVIVKHRNTEHPTNLYAEKYIPSDEADYALVRVQVAIAEAWDDCVGLIGGEPESGTDPLAKARAGYTGGNIAFRDRGLCATVNQAKVAKQRAKNKAVKKNRRK